MIYFVFCVKRVLSTLYVEYVHHAFHIEWKTRNDSIKIFQKWLLISEKKIDV